MKGLTKQQIEPTKSAYIYQSNINKMKKEKNSLATAGMVLGIISLVTSLWIGLGFLPGLVAIIFGGVKRKSRYGVAGLVMGIIGAAISLIFVIPMMLGFLSVMASL